ncbi:MAG: 2OG-Fe(II) oxygenase [Bdellovibrionales bacterium]|nr:2OG-Fe(II) oxygenase [Bdellovibrionales bacterium]
MKDVERFVSVHKSFLPKKLATDLRKAFESVYEDPRHTHPNRFMWDHWHLENQYRMHRTLAREFFPENIYQKLQDTLVKFGQEQLGCHSISDPWLSYYTEGDEQNLHTDSPHGPWAYVFSLTDWASKNFSGGETLILQPDILNYWSHYSSERGFEHSDLFLEIEPEFNQLLVFDPRLPHGVRRVSGVHDPRESRLVVHGWFVNPEPYVTGALDLDSITEVLNSEIGSILSALTVPEDVKGIITIRFKISAAGFVTSASELTNTLIDHRGDNLNSLSKKLCNAFKKVKMPKARGTSELTLPLIFE